MKSPCSLSLVLILILTGAVSAGDYIQRYERPSDGKVLLEVDFKRKVTKKEIEEKWDKDKTEGGVEFYVCRYYAFEKNHPEKLVNDQLVWYFPNPPAGKNTDRSNYWVYWCNPKTSTIWGRCPTPAHPDYDKWVKTKGTDLWQIVPKEDREKVKGVLYPAKAARFMSANILGEKLEKKELPKVKPTDNESDPIFCVDFENQTFAFMKR